MATTVAKGYELQSTGSNSGSWGTVLNSDVFQIIDNNMGAVTTKTLTNVNVTLSASEAQSAVVRLIGTLTGNVQITSACVGFYFVDNATTGSYTVTVTNGVGSAVTCPQGYRVLIIADTTNGCRLGNNPPASAYVDDSVVAAAIGPLAVETAAIAAQAVTYAKIQNMTTSRLLGRTTASSGVIEEISAGSSLTLSSLTLDVAIPSPLRLISTTTVSVQASLPVTSGISSTYDEYEIHVSNLLGATSAADLYFQVSTDGGSNWKTTGYSSSVSASSGTGGSGIGTGTSGVVLDLGSGSSSPDNSSSYGWRGVIRLWPNGSSSRKNVVFTGTYHSTGNGMMAVVGGGCWDGGNDAVTAFRLIASSGNISGTVRLIGVRNSV